ncbi:N/A [soil metagenome]
MVKTALPKALITGMNGTVAPVLASVLREAGNQVVGWDRSAVPTDDSAAILDYIREERPDWFFHLATGSEQWAEAIARECYELDIAFLFTSSVSVYSSDQRGPFTVDIPPTPDEDYGRYKLTCEERILAVNPDARVVRIGWQIGEGRGGNQMVEHLARTFEEEGRIEASTEWYQACSFLSDTVKGLLHVMRSLPGSLYHLDGNPGLSFYEIVTGLNSLLRTEWVIEATASPALNNRLVDSRIPVMPITARFRDADADGAKSLSSDR